MGGPCYHSNLDVFGHSYKLSPMPTIMVVARAVGWCFAIPGEGAWRVMSSRYGMACYRLTSFFWVLTFQISINWDLPWTVDLLLWPAYLLETFLKWSVTWMDVPAQPA